MVSPENNEIHSCNICTCGWNVRNPLPIKTNRLMRAGINLECSTYWENICRNVLRNGNDMWRQTTCCLDRDDCTGKGVRTGACADVRGDRVEAGRTPIPYAAARQGAGQVWITAGIISPKTPVLPLGTGFLGSTISTVCSRKAAIGALFAPSAAA